MKNLNSAIASFLLAGLLCALPVPPAHAQSPKTGKVEYLNLEKGLIVVNDDEFKITSATQIYSPTGAYATPQHLRKGMKVRLNLVRVEGRAAPVLAGIQILP